MFDNSFDNLFWYIVIFGVICLVGVIIAIIIEYPRRKLSPLEDCMSDEDYWIKKALTDFGIIIMVGPISNVKFWVKNPDSSSFVMLFYDEGYDRFAVEVLGGFYSAGPAVRLVSERINRLNALAVQLNRVLIKKQ